MFGVLLFKTVSKLTQTDAEFRILLPQTLNMTVWFMEVFEKQHP